MLMSDFQQIKSACKIECFHTTGGQKKIIASVFMGFWSHCNTVFQAMACLFHFCHCQEVRPSVTEEDIQFADEKRELNKLR